MLQNCAKPTKKVRCITQRTFYSNIQIFLPISYASRSFSLPLLQAQCYFSFRTAQYAFQIFRRQAFDSPQPCICPGVGTVKYNYLVTAVKHHIPGLSRRLNIIARKRCTEPAHLFKSAVIGGSDRFVTVFQQFFKRCSKQRKICPKAPRRTSRSSVKSRDPSRISSQAAISWDTIFPSMSNSCTATARISPRRQNTTTPCRSQGRS